MESLAMTINPEHGTRFDDAEVARAYRFRAPYAPALLESLVSRTPHRERALDLGCGPGKLAAALAGKFANVDAVDPAAAMLHEAQSYHAGIDNIRWLHGSAEDVPLEGPYDLVTIGAAVHWMDHAHLFPRLARLLGDSGLLAVIDGDGAHEPAWAEEWNGFLATWLERLGRRFDPNFASAMAAYEKWMDIKGRDTFTYEFRQSVADFVKCQHSRATFTAKVMGADALRQFDADLETLLQPYSVDGQLEYTVRSQLVWGRPARISGIH